VFTRDGRRVITPGEDGAVIVWNVETRTAEETFTGHGGPARALAVSDDGRTLYSAGADGSVFIWDLAGQRRLGRPFDAGGPSAYPRYAMSSDGRLLAHGQLDGNVTVVDTRTLSKRRSFPVTTVGEVPIDPDLGVPNPELTGMRFLPRSHRLVIGGHGGFLTIVDADSGRLLKRLHGHTGFPYTPGISDDGRIMVTGATDGTVRLWSLADGHPLGAPIVFERGLGDAQLSPDGRWIVAADGSDALQIFDAHNRRLSRRAKGRDGLSFGRFSPDGRLLAVGDVHGRAEVWSSADWKPIARAFAGYGSVDSAAISPNNRTLATGARDGTIRLWDIRTQQPLGTALPGLPGQRVIPIFTPDGTALIAAYDSGRAYRWDIRTASLIRQACSVAGRRLTRAEWEEFLPSRDYHPTC
jgi:WD40 repeat protein